MLPVLPIKHTQHVQERNEVRWRPGQEASLVPPCSNLRSFGSKCTVLKKVLVTLLGLLGERRSDSAPGTLCPFVTPLDMRLRVTQILTLLDHHQQQNAPIRPARKKRNYTYA